MMLSKTRSNACGRCTEGLSVLCGAAGVGAARLVPPASPPWWAVEGRPWEMAEGAQCCADHGSWTAFGLSRSVCRRREQTYILLGAQLVTWGHCLSPVEGLETVMGRQRGCWRHLLWKYQTFSSDFSPPGHFSLPSTSLPVAGQPGREVFPSLQTYVSHHEPCNTGDYMKCKRLM